MVDPAIIEQIKCIVTPENVRIDEPMSLHTTFRIGGPADVFVEIINEHEISRLIDLLKSKDVP